MSVKVYIDGQEGTTGLQILDRFKNRNDIELLTISDDKRKDPGRKSKIYKYVGFYFSLPA